MKLLREVEAQVNRPFSVKLAETKEVIAHHFEEFGDKAAVAFSGGKDSEVVLYLCLQQKPDVDITVVFNNTGVEYPETARFVAELSELWSLNLIVTHPEKSFWDCVEQYGFPSPHDKRRCCYWLKEKPMTLAVRNSDWLGIFDGVTAAESRHRMIRAKTHGSCYHYKAWGICKIHPILWWTKNEVWDFIKRENLPINPIYALEERTGCMPCTAHKHWEERLQAVNPKLYRIIKLRKDNQYVMALE